MMWIVLAKMWKLVDLWSVLLVEGLLLELYAPTSCVCSVSLVWVGVVACMIVTVCSVGCGQHAKGMK